MSMLKIDVDVDGLFDHQLTRIEQDNLPYAAMQAANKVASEVQQQWQQLLRTKLDQPVNLTLKSVYMKRARYMRGSDGTRSMDAAEVFIRDEAAKGTAPARYLAPLVFGGAGHDRGIDRGLRRAGFLSANEFAIPTPDNTLLDSHGNVKNGVVQQILSQLHGQFDALSNQTPVSKGRKLRRKAQSRRFFAVPSKGKGRRAAHLSPGVYWRDGNVDLTKVYNFTHKRSQYAARLDLFGAAQKAWNDAYPFFLGRELDKAVQDSLLRGRS